MTAGDKGLYDTVGEDLDAMGKAKYFLGEVGAASRMKIIVNMVRAVPCLRRRRRRRRRATHARTHACTFVTPSPGYRSD